MANFASAEDLASLRMELDAQYQKLMKLITAQAVAVDQKIQMLDKKIQLFTSRKPDPALIRDFWIQQIPKIREELKGIGMSVAQMKAATEKKGGASKCPQVTAST